MTHICTKHTDINGKQVSKKIPAKYLAAHKAYHKRGMKTVAQLNAKKKGR